MKHALAPVGALLIGVSILLTGQGLQGTLLPVRAGLESFSTLSIGIMGGAYFFGFTLGCLKGGELVKRVGHVRVFAAMTALASASPLLHSLVLIPAVWSFLRLLTGFCFAVLYVVIESWLNERATNESRGIIFSTYVMITLTMMAAGQMMLLLYDPESMQLFAIASVLVSLAAIPVALSTSPTPEPPVTGNVDLRKLFLISRSGTIGCLISGLANGSFWALGPVFATAVSDNVDTAAWFMTSAVFGGALSQWPLGFLSDKLGRRRVMSGAAFAGTLLGVLMVATGSGMSFLQLNLFSAAWGFIAFPIYSIAVAHTNDYAEPNDYVSISSGLLLMYGAGAIIGPFLASALMTALGTMALYAYTGAVHLLLTLYAITRIIRRTSTPEEHNITYRDAMTSALTASSVYEDEMHQAEEDAEEAA